MDEGELDVFIPPTGLDRALTTDEDAALRVDNGYTTA